MCILFDLYSFDLVLYYSYWSTMEMEDSRIAHRVFIENYHRLTNLNLSMLDSYLVSERIITLTDQQDINAAKTNRDRSTLILQAIGNHLKSNITQSLFVMLDLMIECGDIAMEEIAIQMKSQLPRGSYIV